MNNPDAGNLPESAAAGPRESRDLFVWKVTFVHGESCHFGYEGLARAYAGSTGKVERVHLRKLELVIEDAPSSADDKEDAERYRFLRRNFTRLVVSTSVAFSDESSRGLAIVESIFLNGSLRECDESSVDAAVDAVRKDTA